jgi:hypothetical protein
MRPEFPFPFHPNTEELAVHTTGSHRNRLTIASFGGAEVFGGTDGRLDHRKPLTITAEVSGRQRAEGQREGRNDFRLPLARRQERGPEWMPPECRIVNGLR